MRWYLVRGLGRICIVQDDNEVEARKRFLLRHPECREQVFVTELKSNRGGQILEIAKEETGEFKLWLVRGPNHPDCFFKVKSEREARELFLKDVEDSTAFGSTSYTELTMAAFLDICPAGFMLDKDVSF